MTERVDALLDSFRAEQPADLSIERSPRMTEIKVGAQAIAQIDEGQQQLVVFAPPDVRPKLLADYKGARADPLGVVFDLENAADAATGFSLLSHRARVERVGWQYRERSP
jgi:hypothetical protein